MKGGPALSSGFEPSCCPQKPLHPHLPASFSRVSVRVCVPLPAQLCSTPHVRPWQSHQGQPGCWGGLASGPARAPLVTQGVRRVPPTSLPLCSDASGPENSPEGEGATLAEAEPWLCSFNFKPQESKPKAAGSAPPAPQLSCLPPPPLPRPACHPQAQMLP